MNGYHCSLELWDTETGKLLRILPGHAWKIVALAFFPDGQTLASASEDNTLRLWDITSGVEIQEFDVTGHYRGDRNGRQELANVQSAVFSRDLKTAFTGAEGSDLILEWHLSSGKQVSAIRVADSEATVLAISADGTLLASSHYSDAIVPSTIRVSALNADGIQLACFNTDESRCNALDFSPDGRLLVSGMADATALVWDLASARKQAALPAS